MSQAEGRPLLAAGWSGNKPVPGGGCLKERYINPEVQCNDWKQNSALLKWFTWKEEKWMYTFSTCELERLSISRTYRSSLFCGVPLTSAGELGSCCAVRGENIGRPENVKLSKGEHGFCNAWLPRVSHWNNGEENRDIFKHKRTHRMKKMHTALAGSLKIKHYTILISTKPISHFNLMTLQADFESFSRKIQDKQSTTKVPLSTLGITSTHYWPPCWSTVTQMTTSFLVTALVYFLFVILHLKVHVL